MPRILKPHLGPFPHLPQAGTLPRADASEEIRIHSVWEVGYKELAWSTPMEPGPAGKVRTQLDLLCALPLPPHWKGSCRAELGQEEGLGRGQAGQLRLCQVGQGPLTSQMPLTAPIHASLSSRFSAEQTRMVSVASPGPHSGRNSGGHHGGLGGLGVWGHSLEWRKIGGNPKQENQSRHPSWRKCYFEPSLAGWRVEGM